MAPFKSDLVLVQCLRLEYEVVEEWCHQLYRPSNQAVRLLVLVLQEMEECRKISAVRPKVAIVVHVGRLLDGRRGTGVVEVIETPSSEMVANMLPNSALLQTYARFRSSRRLAWQDRSVRFRRSVAWPRNNRSLVAQRANQCRL